MGPNVGFIISYIFKLLICIEIRNALNNNYAMRLFLYFIFFFSAIISSTPSYSIDELSNYREKCKTTIPCIKKGRSFDPHLSWLHIYNGVTNGINPSVATVLHQFFHAIAVTAYSKRSNQRRLKLYHYTI